MTVKTCRVLQGVAVTLFAVALALALLAVPLQNTLISLYGRPGAGGAAFVIPIEAIVKAAMNFIPALVYLLLIRKWKPTATASRTFSLTFAIALAAQKILLSFLLGFLVNLAVAGRGSGVLASYTALNAAISLFTPFLTVPAGILMLLSLGGYWGKDLTWIENCVR